MESATHTDSKPTTNGAVAAAEAITASATVAPAPVSAPRSTRKRREDVPQNGAAGSSLILGTILLMSQMLAIWPAVVAATTNLPVGVTERVMPKTPMLFGLADTTLQADVALIEMVMLAGALGALVGGCGRFLSFPPGDQLTRRDEWIYLVRPVQGAALALIVYFTLRGGYLGQTQETPVNPYGVAAMSALVGLFTRHALSKLNDVFDTLFGKPSTLRRSG